MEPEVGRTRVVRRGAARLEGRWGGGGPWCIVRVASPIQQRRAQDEPEEGGSTSDPWQQRCRGSEVVERGTKAVRGGRGAAVLCSFLAAARRIQSGAVVGDGGGGREGPGWI